MVKERKMPCEVYSRIVGYIRPVQQWGPGKVQEFKDRKPYDVEVSLSRLSDPSLSPPEANNLIVGRNR